MNPVVLLVELPGGEVVAVRFQSREQADAWAENVPYETFGTPRLVQPSDFKVGRR